jgi:hypothetical protein
MTTQSRWLTLSAVLLAATPAHADEFARKLIARAAALLEEASAARVPPRVPPKPVSVKWKAKRLGSVDLDALVAMTSGDLDGDGRAEIVAVTETEVVILAPQGRRALAAVARVALPADAPAIAPREAVAAAAVVATVTGAELRVRSSTSGRGARYTYADGLLREIGTYAAYPLCADREGELARGRAYFQRGEKDGLPAAWPEKYWAAACRGGLVDPEGRGLRAEAVLGADGALGVTVAVRCNEGEAGCTPEHNLAVSGVGVAFAVADVDRDGRPEIITSAASAPGDADTVTVRTMPNPGGKLAKKPVFKKKFSGGVGGIIADDVDGDGDIEVVAAVRLAGAERVDLWLLD